MQKKYLFIKSGQQGLFYQIVTKFLMSQSPDDSVLCSYETHEFYFITFSSEVEIQEIDKGLKDLNVGSYLLIDTENKDHFRAAVPEKIAERLQLMEFATSKDDLDRQMSQAIEAQNYEEAARIRDLIKTNNKKKTT